MKKPEFVPGDVILEVKSNTHLHKIILRKDTLEIIMGPYSYIFDLEKIQSIKSDKGRGGLFTAKTAEIRVVGQPRGVDRTDIWHVLFPHNQNDEINKLVDVFYKTQTSSLQTKGARKDREEKERRIRKKQQQIERLTREKQQQIDRAKERERALDYDSAIGIWEELGEIEEAARVRKLKVKQGSVRVAQKVVKGDEITKTDIRDSVISKSSIGGGSSKMQELEKLTEMKKEGLIDDAEFQQMKKEILGK